MDEIINETVPQGAPATHILKFYPKRHATILYRAEDGIALGLRENQVVIFGENFNKRESRCFISEVKGDVWLEGLAAKDLKDRGIDGPVVFERLFEEEMTPAGIVIPDSAQIDYTAIPPQMAKRRAS
jgi:hypothetical protein